MQKISVALIFLFISMLDLYAMNEMILVVETFRLRSHRHSSKYTGK